MFKFLGKVVKLGTYFVAGTTTVTGTFLYVTNPKDETLNEYLKDQTPNVIGSDVVKDVALQLTTTQRFKDYKFFKVGIVTFLPDNDKAYFVGYINRWEQVEKRDLPNFFTE